MFTARISNDSGLLWGRLLCGKPTGCRGRLGTFVRNYAAAAIPPDGVPFIVVRPAVCTPEEQDDIACTERIRDLWLVQAAGGYERVGLHPLADGRRVPLLAMAPLARRRLLSGLPSGTRRHRSLRLDGDAVFRCAQCGWPNLVQRDAVDAELGRRCAALPDEVCVVRQYQPAELVGCGDARRLALMDEEWYLFRPKGDRAAAWRPFGGRRYNGAELTRPSLFDFEGRWGDDGIPLWARRMWTSGDPAQYGAFPPSAVPESNDAGRWQDVNAPDRTL